MTNKASKRTFLYSDSRDCCMKDITTRRGLHARKWVKVSPVYIFEHAWKTFYSAIFIRIIRSFYFVFWSMSQYIHKGLNTDNHNMMEGVDGRCYPPVSDSKQSLLQIIVFKWLSCVSIITKFICPNQNVCDALNLVGWYALTVSLTESQSLTRGLYICKEVYMNGTCDQWTQ